MKMAPGHSTQVYTSRIQSHKWPKGTVWSTGFSKRTRPIRSWKNWRKKNDLYLLNPQVLKFKFISWDFLDNSCLKSFSAQNRWALETRSDLYFTFCVKISEPSLAFGLEFSPFDLCCVFAKQFVIHTIVSGFHKELALIGVVLMQFKYQITGKRNRICAISSVRLVFVLFAQTIRWSDVVISQKGQNVVIMRADRWKLLDSKVVCHF